MDWPRNQQEELEVPGYALLTSGYVVPMAWDLSEVLYEL